MNDRTAAIRPSVIHPRNGTFVYLCVGDRPQHRVRVHGQENAERIAWEWERFARVPEGAQEPLEGFVK